MAKILIADDDREVRELIIFTLRFAGHEVLGASNGEEACQEAKKHRPNLILMDVRMPKMNGYEACRALKADRATASIPVIFITVRGQDADIQEGLKAGGDDYIQKPISPDKLAAKVKQFLQKGKK